MSNERDEVASVRIALLRDGTWRYASDFETHGETDYDRSLGRLVLKLYRDLNTLHDEDGYANEEALE